MSGSILQVLNLHSHHRSRERPSVVFFLRFWRQQLRGQWRVEGVREQDKLELDLQIDRRKVINKDERCELMTVRLKVQTSFLTSAKWRVK